MRIIGNCTVMKKEFYFIFILICYAKNYFKLKDGLNNFAKKQMKMIHFMVIYVISNHHEIGSFLLFLCILVIKINFKNLFYNKKYNIFFTFTLL